MFQQSWCRLQSLYRIPCSPLLKHMKRLQSTKLPNSFYLAVHPDFFGDHPTEQKVNEESLKILHSYLNQLKDREHTYATTLTFFVKNKQQQQQQQQQHSFKQGHDSIRQVQMKLEGNSSSRIIARILKTCNLKDDTGSIPDDSPEKQSSKRSLSDLGESFYSMEWNMRFRRDWQAEPEETLSSWLTQNHTAVATSQNDGSILNKRITKIMNELKMKYGVRGLAMEESHFSHAAMYHTLKHIQNMLRTYHPETNLLQDRIIKFGLFTGLDQLGKVVLNLHGLPNGWSFGISTIRPALLMLRRIKEIEGCLKEVCCGVNFIRPRGNFHSLPAPLYVKALEHIYTNMNIIDGTNTEHNRSKYKDILCTFDWHVDSIVISREGYLKIPWNIQRAEFLSYLGSNAGAIRAARKQYLEDLGLEHAAMSLCKSELHLRSLEKDPTLTRIQTVKACDELKLCEDVHLMKGWAVVLSKYYSITKDGVVRIPWDFAQ